MPCHEVPALEDGLPHLYAEGLCLVGPGNDASIVVREHDHGFAFKSRVEDPLAGDIEVVAVYQGKVLGHGITPCGSHR